MEKKHEIKLLFKTEFDMDEKDYKIFMNARKKLLSDDKHKKLETPLQTTKAIVTFVKKKNYVAKILKFY